METKKEEKRTLPAGAVILGAKGYRRNGEGMSVVKYRINNENFVMWIPEGGAA